MTIVRRRIDEIVVSHKLHADLQEVFVEGREDKRFYETFLDQNGLGSVAVFDIATVEIDAADAMADGLSDGAKGRVVALARLLEGRILQREVVCIADADLDHFRNKTYSYSLLLLMDYTSIELYILCPSVLNRILRVALPDFPKNADQVINEIRALLEDAFLVRVAAEEFGFKHEYPAHSTFCKMDKAAANFTFDLKEYSRKALEQESCADSLTRVLVRVAELRKTLGADAGRQMRGHDFKGTFVWYIRKHKGFGGLDGAGA